MTETNLKTGDIQLILNALHFAVATPTGWKGDTILTWSCDTAEVDALNEECVREMNGVYYGRERDRVLCKFQMREYGMGAKSYMLNSNIYGYAVGDSLSSNMGGGRWACTPRGLDFAQAVDFGVRQALTQKNVTFSFCLSWVPSDVVPFLPKHLQDAYNNDTKQK